MIFLDASLDGCSYQVAYHKERVSLNQTTYYLNTALVGRTYLRWKLRHLSKLNFLATQNDQGISGTAAGTCKPYGDYVFPGQEESSDDQKATGLDCHPFQGLFSLSGKKVPSAWHQN